MKVHEQRDQLLMQRAAIQEVAIGCEHLASPKFQGEFDNINVRDVDAFCLRLRNITNGE